MKDIEQIWQNCKIYNLDGSAVSRMADVQQLQYRRMRRVSIDSDLSSMVIKSVQDFVDAANKNRARISAASTILPYAKRLPSYIKVASNDSLTPKPGEPFIERLSAKPPATKHASKLLIVFDPTTNTIVRHYTTQRMAMMAISKLSDDGFQPGFSPNTDHFIRKIFKAAAMDPNLTIFGYRWLIYDDILSRSCIFPGFQDKVEKEKPAPSSSVNSSSSKPKSSVKRKSEAGVLIVKKDGASGARLETFESISAAYVDWLQTLQSCLVTPKMKVEEGKKEDMVLFQSQFLNGGAHIDGLQWKLIPYSEKSKLCKSSDKLTRSNRKQGSSVKKKQSNKRQAEPLLIPPAADDHCHAFMLRQKQYCKRKIVNGGNYCLIHMKQMVQGNVANGVKLVSELKGVLPPPRKKSKKQVADSSASAEPGSCLMNGDPKLKAQAQSNAAVPPVISANSKQIEKEGVGSNLVSSKRVDATAPMPNHISQTNAVSASIVGTDTRTSGVDSAAQTSCASNKNPSTSAGVHESANSAFARVGPSPTTADATMKVSTNLPLPSSKLAAQMCSAKSPSIASDAEKIAAVKSMLALSNLKKVAISPVKTSRSQTIPPSGAQSANVARSSEPPPTKMIIQNEGAQPKQVKIATTGSNVASFMRGALSSVQKLISPQPASVLTTPQAVAGKGVQDTKMAPRKDLEGVVESVGAKSKSEVQADASSDQVQSAITERSQTPTTTTPDTQFLALAAVMKFISPSKRRELATDASISDHAETLLPHKRKAIGVVSISLKNQEIIGRWESIRACGRAVNIPNPKLGSMIKDLDPDENGNVYVAGFDNEEEVLQKIRDAVKAGNVTLLDD
uniref:Uncharacterized protein n=1 Tax=Leptocylindrus danicus TaxID=163516 RepID=A0A7S2P681_9STRA